MRTAFAKFGFIHRRLWQRDGLYRAALLLGPAALIGVVAATGLKEAIRAFQGLGGHSPPPAWAVLQRPDIWNVNDDQPQSVQPSAPLPPMTANGELNGYVPGWRATINQMEPAQAFDVSLKRDPISGFAHDGPTVDMARLLAEGPKASLFAGLGSAFLVVKTAGIYSLSASFERPAGSAANCLVRLGFGPKRVVSEVELSLVSDISQTFDPIKFDLQPGLYSIGWAFGCWHEHEEAGPGRMTVLIARPGETQLEPARSGEIVRAKTAGP
jgi:hypothetical protein